MIVSAALCAIEMSKHSHFIRFDNEVNVQQARVSSSFFARCQSSPVFDYVLHVSHSFYKKPCLCIANIHIEQCEYSYRYIRERKTTSKLSILTLNIDIYSLDVVYTYALLCCVYAPRVFSQFCKYIFQAVNNLYVHWYNVGKRSVFTSSDKMIFAFHFVTQKHA